MTVIVKGDFEGPVFGTIHGAHLSSVNSSSVVLHDNDGDGGGGGEK
ncbi:MAG: hypothetical protein MPJ79_00080 [Alphaproteobacteria bacterium]|nr:hypothetical protein [Alphaproteobacteria bacterium]MDA7982523.1 hypothetical protein [Alphaproteobacteria bacterium]MDA8008562.1 hypothetical protein [Alphaproteobacteria bacterium]